MADIKAEAYIENNCILSLSYGEALGYTKMLPLTWVMSDQVFNLKDLLTNYIN